MSDDIRINPRVTIPAGEISITTSRSSGPGGQHVNTTDSRVQLRWNVVASAALGPVQRRRVLAALGSRLTGDGDLILAADAHRSQRRNRDAVVERLVDMVRRALVPPKPRKATRPTAASRERRLKDKKRRARIKRGRGRGHEED